MRIDKSIIACVLDAHPCGPRARTKSFKLSTVQRELLDNYHVTTLWPVVRRGRLSLFHELPRHGRCARHYYKPFTLTWSNRALELCCSFARNVWRCFACSHGCRRMRRYALISASNRLPADSKLNRHRVHAPREGEMERRRRRQIWARTRARELVEQQKYYNFHAQSSYLNNVCEISSGIVWHGQGSQVLLVDIWDIIREFPTV